MTTGSGISDKERIQTNHISRLVITAPMKVHSLLGAGLLESAYEARLAHELRKRGLKVQTQVPLPVVYDGVRLDIGYRVDVLVEDYIAVKGFKGLK